MPEACPVKLDEDAVHSSIRLFGTSRPSCVPSIHTRRLYTMADHCLLLALATNIRSSKLRPPFEDVQCVPSIAVSIRLKRDPPDLQTLRDGQYDKQY